MHAGLILFCVAVISPFRTYRRILVYLNLLGHSCIILGELGTIFSVEEPKGYR